MGSTKKMVLPVIIAAIVLFVLGSIAFGPQWRVDDVTKTGAKHSVTCHEKWRTDHVKTIAVTAAVASTLKEGDECPR